MDPAAISTRSTRPLPSRPATRCTARPPSASRSGEGSVEYADVRGGSIGDKENVPMRVCASALAVVAAATARPVAATTSCRTQDEAVKSAWSEVAEPVPAPRGPDSEPGGDGEGFAAQERARARRRHRGACQGDSIQVHAGVANDPEAFAAVPGGPGRASSALSAPDGGGRELSGPQVRCELPRSAGAAGRHREPHHGGAQSLHPGGAGVTTSRCAGSPRI